MIDYARRDPAQAKGTIRNDSMRLLGFDPPSCVSSSIILICCLPNLHLENNLQHFIRYRIAETSRAHAPNARSYVSFDLFAVPNLFTQSSVRRMGPQG
jgi:hypothetical protein